MTTSSRPSRKGLYFPLFVGLDALLWLVAFTWAPPKVPDPPVLAVNIWPGTESLIVARETGLVSRKSINFVEMSWSTASMRAFGNRAADVAVLSLSETLLLHELGSSFRLILAVDESEGADAIVGREGLSGISDLKGKKVGVEVRSAGHYLLSRAIEEAGLTFADIELIPLNLPESETAFAELEVDAVVTSEPWLTRILKKNRASVIYDSNETPGELLRVMVARESTIDESGPTIAALIDAHFEKRDPALWPKEVLEGILRREGISVEEFTESLSRITRFSTNDQKALLSGTDPELKRNLGKVMSHMQLMGLISPVPIDSIIIDDSFID
jgi:NitT/TauT family transport system substrate-binding protein